ncbi:hypothetical protein D3C71_1738200 [compost metagenome]
MQRFDGQIQLAADAGPCMGSRNPGFAVIQASKQKLLLWLVGGIGESFNILDITVAAIVNGANAAVFGFPGNLIGNFAHILVILVVNAKLVVERNLPFQRKNLVARHSLDAVDIAHGMRRDRRAVDLNAQGIAFVHLQE